MFVKKVLKGFIRAPVKLRLKARSNEVIYPIEVSQVASKVSHKIVLITIVEINNKT